MEVSLTGLPSGKRVVGIVLGWGLLLAGFFTGHNFSIAQPAQYVAPCAIQGRYYRSPYEGEYVTTQGIVFLDLDETPRQGFFLQLADCDNDEATSDGLFVYLGEHMQVVNPGDHVEVSGVVQEYFGFTELVSSPSLVTVISSGFELPPPTRLAPPFDLLLSDPYLEAREGMRVMVERGAVVGPTDNDDKSWIVPVDLGVTRVFAGDPRETGEIICLDDEGLFELDPEVKVGDEVSGVDGALDYALGVYCIQLRTPAEVYPAIADETLRGAGDNQVGEWRLATYNLENLFDAIDDPEKEDIVLSAAEYQRRLNKHALTIHFRLNEPDLIAVQEAENLVVLQALLLESEIEAEYGIIWHDCPDIRGIDIALLYRLDRVEVALDEVHQGCTTLVDGFGPDGNLDLDEPANAITCDSDGDGLLDGNRLFSRPPLVVNLKLCDPDCDSDTATKLPVVVVVNHWKSKTQDTDYAAYTLPRRIEQAEFVTQLGNNLQARYPWSSLVILGDLNDDPFSQPLGILAADNWQDLTPWIAAESRYSFIYHGISQVMDYALVKLKPNLGFSQPAIIHTNADFPAIFAEIGDTVYRASDHDIVLASLVAFDSIIYLPVIEADSPVLSYHLLH